MIAPASIGLRRNQLHYRHSDLTKGNYGMAKRKKRRQRILWTAAHEKQLRRLSGRTPAAKIARTLSRSEAAVRYKAHTLGLSLAVKRR